jgi:predicted ATPase/DNA-binding SARP family transcriptional activator
MDTHNHEGKHARFRMLGGLTVVNGPHVLTGPRDGKVASLLAYLAYHAGRSYPRETLTELFWPEMDPALSSNRFRVTLNRVRKLLLALRLPVNEALLVDGTHVCLSSGSIATDVAEFDALVRQANGLSAEPGLDLLERAAALYQGPLLAGYQEDWIQGERQRREEEYLDTLKKLISGKIRLQEYDQALSFARQALPVDPYREETHQEIIRIYLAIGRVDSARRQYRDMERLLKTELGITPSRSVRALLEQIEKAADDRVFDRYPATSVPVVVPPPLVTTASFWKDTDPRLPSSPTSFFGREEDLTSLCTMLLDAQIRCVTITGPAGCGKTRLAIEAARRLRSDFAGGVFWVPLERSQQPEQVPERIADALSVKLAPGQDALSALVATLLDRPPTLLILDNLEHLLDGEPNVASIVHALLTETTVSFLGTSRQRLSLSWEREYLLLPLLTPAPRSKGRPDDVDYLLEFPSIRLFVDRVRSVRPSFALTPQNAMAVSELCHHLDGLPLAIELTAAWARTLTVPQILARLNQRFDIFPSVTRDTPSRHQTLRSAIEWSYRLLSPELQRFFRSLAIFQGGWTANAAASVTDTLDVLLPLHELQTRSLILGQEQSGVMRFYFLETLREFALMLLSDDERRELRARHASYFTAWSEGFDTGVATLNSAAFLDAVETEDGNLCAALDLYLKDPGHAEPGIQIVTRMYAYWRFRSGFATGRRYIHAFLQIPVTDQPLRCTLLRLGGEFAERQGDFAEAQSLLAECVRTAREIGDEEVLQVGLNALGNLVIRIQEPPAAFPYYEEALALARKFGDPFRQVMPLINLGDIVLEIGKDAEAQPYYEEALSLSRTVGFDRGICAALASLAQVYGNRHEYDTATSYFEEALQRLRQMGERWGIGMIQSRRGRMLRMAGRYTEAEDALREALSIFREAGSKPFLSFVLWGFAYLFQWRNAPLSVRLLAAIDSFRHQVPDQIAAEEPVLRQRLRDTLGDLLFRQHYEVGRTQTLDSAAGEVLDFLNEIHSAAGSMEEID